MDELAALTRHQRESQECSIMLFTETYTDITVDGFQTVHRTSESGKRKGGGLAMFVNDRWCNPGHISIKEDC